MCDDSERVHRVGLAAMRDPGTKVQYGLKKTSKRQILPTNIGLEELFSGGSFIPEGMKDARCPSEKRWLRLVLQLLHETKQWWLFLVAFYDELK